jgi:uncharacterized small protein (DUF1192 family)
MRTTCLLAALLVSTMVLAQAELNEVDVLRAENDLLKRKVQRLEKRIADLQAELEKLKAEPARPEVAPGAGPEIATRKPGEADLILGDLVAVVKRAAQPQLTDLQRTEMLESVRGKRVRLECVVRDVSSQTADGFATVQAYCRSREEATGAWAHFGEQPGGATSLPAGKIKAPVVYCVISAFVPRDKAAKLKRSQVSQVVGTIEKLSDLYPLRRLQEREYGRGPYPWTGIEVAIRPAEVVQ